jgi:transcriptional regulator with XRE-family HTH domain
MSVATIGSALAEKRQALGLEKGQAADKIGMSRTTYSSYEQDAQRPSVDVFPALAEFLQVSMDELLNLYGATCVAAIRPALERLLSDRGAETVETPSPLARFEVGETTDSPEATNEWETAEISSSSEAPERSPSTSWYDAETSEVVLELKKDASVPGTEEKSPPSSSEVSESSEVVLELGETEGDSDAEDAQNEESGLPSRDFNSELALEREEVVTEATVRDQVVPQTMDLDDEGGSSDSFLEPREWLHPPTQSEEAVRSAVFEPSPYFIRTSLSEGISKSHDPKKKKKKKKKKK